MPSKPMQYYEKMPNKHKTFTLASIQALAATILSLLSIGLIFNGFMPSYATSDQMDNMYQELKLSNIKTQMAVKRITKERWDADDLAEYNALEYQLNDLNSEANKRQ